MHASDVTNTEGLLAAEQILEPQVEALNVVQKKLGDAQHYGSSQIANVIRQLVTQLQRVQSALTTDLTNVRATRAKIEVA